MSNLNAESTWDNKPRIHELSPDCAEVRGSLFTRQHKHHITIFWLSSYAKMRGFQQAFANSWPIVGNLSRIASESISFKISYICLRNSWNPDKWRQVSFWVSSEEACSHAESFCSQDWQSEARSADSWAISESSTVPSQQPAKQHRKCWAHIRSSEREQMEIQDRLFYQHIQDPSKAKADYKGWKQPAGDPGVLSESF